LFPGGPAGVSPSVCCQLGPFCFLIPFYYSSRRLLSVGLVTTHARHTGRPNLPVVRARVDVADMRRGWPFTESIWTGTIQFSGGMVCYCLAHELPLQARKHSYSQNIGCWRPDKVNRFHKFVDMVSQAKIRSHARMCALYIPLSYHKHKG